MTAPQIVAPPHGLGLDPQANVVSRYFTLFNLGKYQQVAALFTPDGALYPPFESPIVGSRKIADYLAKEADGMQVSLLSKQLQTADDGCLQVNVQGSVRALVFNVNVTWSFVVTEGDKIQSVRVDLVATLEELLKLRP